MHHIVLYTPYSASLSVKPPSDYLTPMFGVGNIEMEENAAYVGSLSVRNELPPGDSETEYDYILQS